MKKNTTNTHTAKSLMRWARPSVPESEYAAEAKRIVNDTVKRIRDWPASPFDALGRGVLNGMVADEVAKLAAIAEAAEGHTPYQCITGITRLLGEAKLADHRSFEKAAKAGTIELPDVAPATPPNTTVKTSSGDGRRDFMARAAEIGAKRDEADRRRQAQCQARHCA